jgi:hypothetical protein
VRWPGCGSAFVDNSRLSRVKSDCGHDRTEHVGLGPLPTLATNRFALRGSRNIGQCSTDGHIWVGVCYETHTNPLLLLRCYYKYYRDCADMTMNSSPAPNRNSGEGRLRRDRNAPVVANVLTANHDRISSCGQIRKGRRTRLRPSRASRVVLLRVDRS